MNVRGFCSSYSEVEKYEMFAEPLKVQMKSLQSTLFSMYFADSIDHNPGFNIFSWDVINSSYNIQC